MTLASGSLAFDGHGGKRKRENSMPDKKEKPISIRLSTKALARLNRLVAELDMNRTSVIQEALKALEREHEAQKAAGHVTEAAAQQNGSNDGVGHEAHQSQRTNAT